MANIDFPNSPSVNDLFTVNDRTWIWTGTTWDTVEETVIGPTGPTGPAGPTGPTSIVLQAEQPSVTNVVWVDTDEEPTNNIIKAVVGAGEFNTSIPAGSYLVNSKSNFKIGATLYPAATDKYFSFTTTVTSVTKYLDTIEPTLTGGTETTDLKYLNNTYVSWIPNNPDSTVSISTDGVTWATSTVTGMVVRNIVYGDSKYVAFGYDGGTAAARIQTSTNGITWTSRSTIFTNTASPGNAIAYGNGIFLAASGNQLATSTDGITWTTAAVGWSSNFLRLAYASGVFLGAIGGEVSTSGYSLTRSTDGITWATNFYGSNGGLYMLEEANNEFWFATRQRQSISGIERTFDQLIWSTSGFSFSQRLSRSGFEENGYRKMGYGSGYYVIEYGESTSSTLFISSNGTVWSTSANQSGTVFRGILNGTTLVTNGGNRPVTSQPTVFQPIEDYTVPN